MTKRNSFDFSHTCPKIDKAITAAKDTIKSYLKDYINDLCPYIPDGKAIELSNDWGETIYNDISDCFETVRETNEDMRDEANRQISALEDEVDSLKDEIKQLAQ
jgi:uncharacterized protein Yka (UPF0111/DUF47 family)